MKKIYTALTVLSLTFSQFSGACENECNKRHECNLTESQRDSIWRELQFTIKKMHISLSNADSEARKISDVDIESATRGAIAGAVAGIQSKNVYGVIISGCLGSIGMIAGDSYIHFRRSKSYVQDAYYYAYHADELQERLWYDK